MHYTEPGIRVVTVFFAALIGFGLKHLVDVTEHGAPGIYPHRAMCFVLAVLLFLRFLLGSANHLWHEHSRCEGLANKPKLGIDLLFLVVFGLIAICICYADSLEHFLWRNMYLLVAAFAWSCLDAAVYSDQRPWCKVWVIIDLVQGLFLLWVASCMTDVRDPLFGWALWWVILLPVYVLCLVFDFNSQMRVLEPKTGADNGATSGAS